jgi:hypothetical protein
MTTARDTQTRQPPDAAAVRAMGLAAHEAGHAVAAHALGWEVGMLSFMEDGAPYLQFRPAGAGRDPAVEADRYRDAGPAWQKRSLGRRPGLPPSPGAVRDREEVQALATRRFPAHPRSRRRTWRRRSARHRPPAQTAHRRAFQTLVEAILRGEQLSAERTQAIIAAASKDAAPDVKRTETKESGRESS